MEKGEENKGKYPLWPLISKVKTSKTHANINDFCRFECYYWSVSACTIAGSNVMKSIHGVGELMTQVVLRGGGLLPTTPTHQPEGDVVKTQTEPEREDIMVMDTKLKVIEILQVGHQETGSSLTANALCVFLICILTFCLFL